MNSKEFIKAVDLIVKEKGIDRELVFEAMELALATAYKKNFGSKTNVRVDINRTTGEIVSRFNDLNLIKDMINKLIFNVFVDFPLLIISFILLWIIDMNLCLILLGLIFIYGLFVFFLQPYINKYIE